MLPIYVINLDADVKRLVAIGRQFESLGLAWERISAIDGMTLSTETVRDDNRRARVRKLSACEIGCLRSHVQAWRKIAEGHDPAALVLEDDMQLSPDLHLFVNDPSWIVDDDCIIRLETFCMPVVLGGMAKTVHGRGLYALRSIQHGAGAYILTQKRARALLAEYKIYVDAADNFMFRYPRINRVYQFSPAICIQNKHAGGYQATECHTDRKMYEQRKMALRQSWTDPESIARRLKWKFASIAGIGCDRIRGYPFRSIPYA